MTIIHNNNASKLCSDKTIIHDVLYSLELSLREGMVDIIVDAAFVVRHGNERVRRMVARRREARVGERGEVKILTEVLWQNMIHENVFKQPFVTRPQNNIVVLQVLSCSVGPESEIDDDQRHRLLQGF